MRVTRLLSFVGALLIWGGCLFAWFSVAAIRFPASGIARFTFPIDGQSPWFEPFLPAQRVTQAGPQPDVWTGQRILMEPVYANIRLPGAFDTLTMGIDLRTIRQPLVEFGIVRSLEPFQAEMQPLWSEVLSSGWKRVVRGDVQGYVRTNLPDDRLLTQDMSKVLTWFATSTSPTLMDQANPSKTWNTSLRGAHDFYLVPVDGHINVQLLIQDMNRTGGQNILGLRLSHDEDTIWTDALSLAGSEDKAPTKTFQKDISIQDLKPGVYRLTISAENDLFIRQIQTDAKRWVIGPRLFAADTVGYSTSTPSFTMWTNSQHLAAEVVHLNALQTVTLGTKAVAITKTHEHVAVDRLDQEKSEPVQMHAPKGNVELIGDGFFAFEKDALFLPKPRRLTDASDPIKEGIEVILTPYKQPTKIDTEWWHVTSTFSLPQGVERVKLALGAPGIFSRQGAIDLRSLDLEFSRPPMSRDTTWIYLKRELSALWHRL